LDALSTPRLREKLRLLMKVKSKMMARTNSNELMIVFFIIMNSIAIKRNTLSNVFNGEMNPGVGNPTRYCKDDIVITRKPILILFYSLPQSEIKGQDEELLLQRHKEDNLTGNVDPPV
jgi:hypothetical protein